MSDRIHQDNQAFCDWYNSSKELDEMHETGDYDGVALFAWNAALKYRDSQPDVLRQPLTHDQISSLWSKFEFPEKLKVVTFAKAIERVHGIGGNDES